MADQQQKRDFELTDEFYKLLPPGFRFKPEDDELIIHYLNRKVHKQPLPRHNMKEVDLYKYNPQDLAVMHRPYGNEWYFFTPRDRKYPKGDKPKRNTVDGYWKATGADKKIRRNRKEIGCMKTLVYYKGKAGNGEKTDWIMREYTVDASKQEKGSKQLDDVVLCRLYKRAANSSNNSKKKKAPTKRNNVKEKDEIMKPDDEVPCNDLQQPQRCYDAPPSNMNMMMAPYPMGYSSDSGHGYQNNFCFSSDYNTDSVDPLLEIARSSSQWHPEQFSIDQNNLNSMILNVNAYNFPAVPDQMPMPLPLPNLSSAFAPHFSESEAGNAEQE